MGLYIDNKSDINNNGDLLLVKEKNTHIIHKPLPDPFWIARNFNLQKRDPMQWAIKRVFDIAVCIFGLIITSPVLLILAVLIKLESEGPVLYKSKRTGLYGKEFYLYKFRSMRQDAELHEDNIRQQFNEGDNIMYKMEDDPRITKLGKFIRKYSLDELPQFINVLKGEMSLVGPRARATRDLWLYKNWHYIFFASVPGITGMWQANGRSNLKDFDKVVKLEFDYITKWNLGLDFYLLLKTIPAVILGKGAA
ncbi:MAG: exopolysaccharide biosynthesis polyprenyl glycosylphosphotransferase [uncultured bacterium]|nr:MAG: exopolysaccharide biosynthesis polyprenyl glycosylphosphotransferase [uncultured bacterium]HBH17652.1 hypothetical protein [Cyanobacteria bacterium UBA9579]